MTRRTKEQPEEGKMNTDRRTRYKNRPFLLWHHLTTTSSSFVVAIIQIITTKRTNCLLPLDAKKIGNRYIRPPYSFANASNLALQ